VRYAVANTPYFCTLFNSYSLILLAKAIASKVNIKIYVFFPDYID
jgi:thymidylate synthase